MVTLGAVVAAATVVFSVVEGVLLRPLPYPDGDRLYRAFYTSSVGRGTGEGATGGAEDRLPVTRDALGVWSQGAEAVEGVGGYVSMLGPWGDDLEVKGAFVLGEFFEVLGARPLLGRLPSAEEMREGAGVLLLSEDLWTTRFGRDPDVLGRTLRYTWTAGTVVGILPREFAVPSEEAGWWSPVPPNFADGRTDVLQISAIARLRVGAGVDEAATELLTTLTGLASANPVYEGLGVRLAPLRGEVVGDVRNGLLQLFWAVLLVVIIASVNLTTLVIARASRRRGELAMRAALGAGRKELVGSILAEVLLLCGAGGVVGVVGATVLVAPVVDFLAGSLPGIPRLDNVGVSLSVLGFALGVTSAAAALSGLVPALVWSNRPPWEAIKGARPGRGGRGVRRTYAGLLLVESGLAVVLLVAAGLLVRSVVSSHAVDPGFDDRGTAFLQVSFSAARAAGSVEIRAAGERLEAELSALPTVTSVGRARVLPTLGGTRRNLVWTPDGGQQEGGAITSVEVSSGYFRAMGIAVVQGRTFQDEEGAGAESETVISQRLARILFGDEDPVGRPVMFGTRTRTEGNRLVSDGGYQLRVVGVVGDVRQESLILEPVPVIYLPLAQGPAQRHQSVVVSTTREPADELATLLRAVEDSDAGATVTQAGALGSAARRPLAPLRVRTLHLVALGGLAGLLILVGIYGVVAHVVSQGLHEICVRMALGARGDGESVRVVLGTLRPVLAGGGLGLAAATVTARLLEDALYGVGPLDPLTYAAVLALLLAMGALAAWLPARRAVAVDPVRLFNT